MNNIIENIRPDKSGRYTLRFRPVETGRYRCNYSLNRVKYFT